MIDQLIIDPDENRSWERFMDNRRPFDLLMMASDATAVMLSLGTLGFSIIAAESHPAFFCLNAIIPLYIFSGYKIHLFLDNKITQIWHRDWLLAHRSMSEPEAPGGIWVTEDQRAKQAKDITPRPPRLNQP